MRRNLLLLPILGFGLLACGGGSDEATAATATTAVAASGANETGGGSGGDTGAGLCVHVTQADMELFANGAEIGEAPTNSDRCVWGAQDGSNLITLEWQDDTNLTKDFAAERDRIKATALAPENFEELSGIGDAAFFENYLATAGNARLSFQAGDKVWGVYFSGGLGVDPARVEPLKAKMVEIAKRMAAA